MATAKYLVWLLWCVVIIGVLPGQERSVDALVRDGVAKAGRRDFKAALVPLDAALKTDPDNVEARRWRGHCRNALGMHAEALVDYDQAIRLQPGYAWSWYARGMAKHHLNRFEAAIADYTQALKLDPKNHKAVEWRGYNKGILGDHLGAYLDFNRAQELDPKNPWVYFTRGRTLCNLGDLRRARQDFLTTLRLQPKHAEAHAQLGFLLVATGDNAAALASFDKAFELDANDQDHVRLWRYWLRVSTGKPGDNAREELPTRGWPGDLARVLLGELTQEQLMQRFADEETNPTEMQTRRCEAFFYLGLRALLTGKRDVAREHLKEAVVVGDPTMPEWRAARHLARRR
ncbi:MAG: tetratricopeptide repeat protein [Planctomycetota bacterium]